MRIKDIEFVLYLYMNQNKTEIVLLTGYLGAGKTTLIKHILTGQNTYKVAII